MFFGVFFLQSRITMTNVLTFVSPLVTSTFGHSIPPLATPVILYDGSEEELMDTIEREFS